MPRPPRLPLLIALLAATLHAQDVVELKSGATMEGTIVASDDQAVVLEFDGGTVELARGLISSIARDVTPEAEPARQALLTLSRFVDHEDHHFLYRDGRRVGFRVVTLNRAVHDGIPVYEYRDRLTFTPTPGAPPEVDVTVIEKVDAEHRPVAFSLRVTSGVSHRIVEGVREDNKMRLVETMGGNRNTRIALLREGIQFPGLLLKDHGTSSMPDGGYAPQQVFDPRDVTIRSEILSRTAERVSVRGKVSDVFVFRRKAGNRTLDTWLDMAGNVVREEIGSPSLISLRAPRNLVDSYARGEGDACEDLGLEVSSEASGFRLLRPSQSWELAAGDPKRRALFTLLRPALQATVDVLELPLDDSSTTEEAVAMGVLARMEETSANLQVDGPFRGKIGDREGLRFNASCRRDDHQLRTTGAILVRRDRAFVILCAAPNHRFSAAFPSFVKILDSVKLIEDDVPAEFPADLFEN